MKIKLFCIAICTMLLVNCSTIKENKNASIGLASGVIVGGIVGKLLTKDKNKTAGAIVIGAAIGGVAGAAIGKYMDNQKKELEKSLGNEASVERVGEGLQVTFNSGVLFGFDSNKLSDRSKINLDSVAAILSRYDETNILVDGHTDSVGDEKYNMNLSNERASNVQNYLINKGVDKSRLGTRGFGESSPVASNDTADGREKNRRVEIIIWANDKLKDEAASGTVVNN